MGQTRGCRGRGSKKRSREKWLKKIGAAYAHHCGEVRHGLCAVRGEGSAAHRVEMTSGAAAQKTSWSGTTPKSLWSGTTPKEAKRPVFAPRSNECAQSALTGAAVNAHREDAATAMAAHGTGDAVVGQRGVGDLTTPKAKMNSAMVLAILVGIALWWMSGWCPTTGVTSTFTVALLLWLEGWLVTVDIVPVAAMKGLLKGVKNTRLTLGDAARKKTWASL